MQAIWPHLPKTKILLLDQPLLAFWFVSYILCIHFISTTVFFLGTVPREGEREALGILVSSEGPQSSPSPSFLQSIPRNSPPTRSSLMQPLWAAPQSSPWPHAPFFPRRLALAEGLCILMLWPNGLGDPWGWGGWGSWDVNLISQFISH